YLLYSPFQECSARRGLRVLRLADSDILRSMPAIQNNFVRVSSVIASDYQFFQELRAFFRIEAKLVKGVELYPLNFHGSGRSMANQTFIFSIYLDVQLADLSVAGVPRDLSACGRLVWIAGWNGVRIRRKHRSASCAGS